MSPDVTMCLVGQLTPMTRKKCIAQKIQLEMGDREHPETVH